jgi:hypothetical protein
MILCLSVHIPIRNIVDENMSIQCKFENPVYIWHVYGNNHFLGDKDKAIRSRWYADICLDGIMQG